MPHHPLRAVRARRGLLSLLVPLLASLAWAEDAADTSALPEPWRSALRFEFNRASEEFARLHAEDPADARLALGRAASLLARQPRTQANVLAARALLERIATSGSASVDQAIAARLFLGRLAESHLSPPRPEEARERYDALLRDHAGHLLADQAAVHLALLTAFPGPGDDALPPDEVRSRIDALRERVGTPSARRELHALQARLLLQRGLDQEALPHLVAARAVGYRQPDHNANADLTIGNIARTTGDAALALSHYRAFLRERPRDARATTVRRYIAELEAAESTAPAVASTR